MKEAANWEQELVTFAGKQLDEKPDCPASVGSEVRVLLGLRWSDVAHLTLPPERTSKAVVHKTVEEIW